MQRYESLSECGDIFAEQARIERYLAWLEDQLELTNDDNVFQSLLRRIRWANRRLDEIWRIIHGK